MSEEATAIALMGEDILGYWGTGNATLLQKQLQQTGAQIDQSRVTLMHSCATTADAIALWGVSLIGKDRPTVPATLPALQCRISITGCAPDPTADATVTLYRDRLILQRDGFGRVPLYWLQTGSILWFASRWQWLYQGLSQQRDRPTLHLPAAYGYACCSYLPTPLTPLAEIIALPAATHQTWTLTPNPLTSHPQPPLPNPHPPTPNPHPPTPTWIWQEAHPPLHDEATAIAQLQTLLQAAVQTQIADLPDAPVGVFLSGGLDSSIVAALLVQAGLKVRAYTLNLGETGLSELPYAGQVAEFLNIPLVTVDVSPRKIRAALMPTAQALDLPYGDGVTVPLYLLAQAASQEVGVVFNGEGGDQLFAGWTNKPLIAAGVYHAAQPEADPLSRQYLRTFHRLWGYEAQLFQPDGLAQIAGLNPEQWLAAALDAEACPSLLHRLRRATLMLKGAQNIHPRATALGRAHGLKVRSPFCSLPLAEFAFQLSSDLHLQGACEKYILKRAVNDWLPSAVVWRTKRGMGVPLTTWCLGELWHDLGTWLNPARLQQEGIWHPQIAHRIVTGQLGTIQGRRIGECLWLLLMWQVWRQTTFGDQPGSFSLNHPFWLPTGLSRSYCRFHHRLRQGNL